MYRIPVQKYRRVLLKQKCFESILFLLQCIRRKQPVAACVDERRRIWQDTVDLV